MEHTAVFEEKVSLTPRDLRGQITTIDALLEEKCKMRLEGHCSRHGFVVPDSVKILSRSMGSVERGRFTGNIIFHVQAEGSVLNPPDGIVIDGTVIRKNKMGLYVNYKDAVRVIIPRDINIGNDEFETVEVGQTVSVEIKKSRFQINDEYILSVGLFHGGGGAKAVVAEEDEEEGKEDEIEEEEEEGKEDDEEEEGKEEEEEEEGEGKEEEEEGKEDDTERKEDDTANSAANRSVNSSANRTAATNASANSSANRTANSSANRTANSAVNKTANSAVNPVANT